MTTEFSGSGDPARSLALLWGAREQPSRGPKPGLTVEQIVGAAIAIADADGLDALSMRRVAERLGVGTMSLYTYVPSKAELIDVMLDTACGTVPSPVGDGQVGWRARLRQVALDNWGLYHRHPWLLHIATGRPTLGPNVIARYEHELCAIEGIGLDDVEMDSVISLVHGHVEGAARRKLEAQQAELRSGLTDQEWWAASAPFLQQVFDPVRFPLASRVGAAAGAEHNAAFNPDRAFTFGLDRVLDGVEALVRSRTETAADSAPA